ncbi:conserved protein of unknown function [Pararobbsia alpina]|uniref:hypothetical protein n=1 Tax=Pararobbsia alpina TaxID=621374 RepID=UPI0039A46ACA
MSSILGAITRPPHATNYSSGTNSSTTFDDVSELDLSLTSSQTGSASVSLSSNLSGVSASTPAGQFAVGFAQAIDSATYVDQATGKREIQQGKAGELASALNALLTQNGFTQDQASQMSQSLETELANGDPLSLSSSYDSISSSTVSATGAYGGNAVWTANSVTQTERSGTLNISIDASGQLNVAMNSQTVSTAQYTGEIKGTGTAPTGPVVIVDLPGLDGSTQGIALSGDGSMSGTPAFESFGQATQSALAALQNAMPASLLNGTTAPSANSPLKETDAEAAIASATTVAMLVTTRAAGASDAANTGDSGDGSNNQSQSNSATDAGATSNDGSGANGAAGSGNDSLTTLLSAVKSEASSLVQLLDSVSKTTLMGTKDTQKRLQDLLDLARQALDPNSASSTGSTDASSGADGNDGANGASGANGANGTNGTSGATGVSSISSSTSLEVEISFTQTLSVQLVDASGYGSTLFARPDGSLGKMVTQPTRVTA